MNKARRRLRQLLAQDERAGRGSVEDARFFEQHPERNFRLRLATPGEVAEREMFGVSVQRPGDHFCWIAIKQITPGLRVRLHAEGPAPVGPIADISEAIARAVFMQILG
jgi:hypothetical protein